MAMKKKSTKKPPLSETLLAEARKHRNTDLGEQLGFLGFLQAVTEKVGKEQLGIWWDLLQESKPDAATFWILDSIRHFQAAILSCGSAIYHDENNPNAKLHRLMEQAMERQDKAVAHATT